MQFTKPFCALAVLLLLLAACAPAPVERVNVVQMREPPTYYSHPTGALWRYLPEGEARTAPALVQQVEGPTVIGGARLTAWRTTGRGIETRTYREYRDDGVYIVREAGPGYVTTISPPVQEWPRPGTLHLGKTWGGEAVATVTFTDAKVAEEVRLEYRSEVVDRRPVETAAGAFDVFVVAFESRAYGPDGATRETLRQEVWFAPFVGEVRTDSGLFLVETNLPAPPSPRVQNMQLAEQFSALDEQQAKLRRELQAAQEQRRALALTNRTRQGQVDEVQDRNQRLSRELNAATRDNQDLKRELMQMQTRVQTLSDELTVVKRERNVIQTNLQRVQQDRAVTLTEANDTQAEVDALKRQLDKVQLAAQELTKRLEEVTAQNRSLREELSTITAEHERLLEGISASTGLSRNLLLKPRGVQLRTMQRQARTATIELRDFLATAPVIEQMNETQRQELNTLRRKVMQAQGNVARLVGAQSIYTVRSGDFLSGVARDFYGHGYLWPDIIVANPFLESAEDLFVGMILVIP